MPAIIMQTNSHNIHRINLEECLGETNYDFLLENPLILSSIEQYQEAAASYLEKIRVEELMTPRTSTKSESVTDTNSINNSLRASRDSFAFDYERQERHDRVTFGNFGYEMDPPMPSIGYHMDSLSMVNNQERNVYEVQFKHNFRYFTTQPGDFLRIVIGSFVVVKCDFGEDIGVVTGIQSMTSYYASKSRKPPLSDAEDDTVGVILQIATLQQRQFLPVKLKKEGKAMKTILRLAHETYNLPIKIIGVEYQADGRKLSIHYVADVHIDFRDLVKDLYTLYKVRIWMKKCNVNSVFAPKKYAVLSLTTGTSHEENWEKHMY